MFWVPQSIRHVCGLYALLHSVCNGDARKHILPNTPLSRLLEKTSTLTSSPELARVLEDDSDIEEAHCSIGRRGNTPIPDVSEQRTGKRIVYDKVLTPDQDSLSEPVLDLIRGYIKDLSADGNLEFSLMALVEDNSMLECIGTDVH
ncbi:cysteine proteinase [Guyanagaster necrorhizus]|uniref:Cysteine proteinase n=1 Tax=Guyanagaster necrorhizus TaxID=856835 RepID=A0A9P7VHD9_9AGAR|nr:cysteine proteinase [Guyanagaster necrorhizus MCA 3950]KAG7440081.1 cysteine proteinase [Guyanagaster necrorhizus MCA 3950]